jgi:hypothetical protein
MKRFMESYNELVTVRAYVRAVTILPKQIRSETQDALQQS